MNPGSGAAPKNGFPWDLLRKYRSDSTYIAVSSQRQRILADVLQQLPDRVRVIPNGIDPVELLGLSEMGNHLVNEFDLFSADLIILMPIRVTRAKNIEFAMKVGAELKAAGTRFRLIITGPPDPHVQDIEDYYTDLKNLRLALGLTNEVVFVYEGTSRYAYPFIIGQELVAELYRVSDLVLMPSLREGFGLPVLEAGLMDRPIFAAPMPIVDEIGKGLVFVIEPGRISGKRRDRIQSWAEQDISHQLRVQVRGNYAWPSVFSNKIEPLIKQVVELPHWKRTMSEEARIILVSHRGPYKLRNTPDGIKARTYDRRIGICSIAARREDRRSLDYLGRPGGAIIRMPPRKPRFELLYLSLTSDQKQKFYYGLSNNALWPLCHSFLGRVHYDMSEWQVYEQVNNQFALAALEEAHNGDTFWVHDYQMARAPFYIRRSESFSADPLLLAYSLSSR